MLKKTHLICTGLLLLSLSSVAQSKKEDDKKYGYAIGILIHDQMQSNGEVVDIDALCEGLKDSHKKKAKMTKEEALKFVQGQAEIRKQKQQEAKKNEEKAFFDKNAKQKGVNTTPSGLQYLVLKQGAGKQPTASDDVVVHYEGKLLDGKVFDSSYKRNAPATFNAGQLIKGFTEGLLMMKEGSKDRFFIPYSLGYGERGNSGIPPFSTLIFEVELQKVK